LSRSCSFVDYITPSKGAIVLLFIFSLIPQSEINIFQKPDVRHLFLLLMFLNTFCMDDSALCDIF